MHPETLLWAGTAMKFCAGLAFVLIWLGDRRLKELAVWATALLLQTAGAAAFAGHQLLPGFWRILAGNGLVIASYSLMWCAVRILVGRRPHPAALLPPLAWGLACLHPDFMQSWPTRVAMLAVLCIPLDLVCIQDLWRQRSVRLSSRQVAMGLFGLHALLLLVNGAALIVANRFSEVVAWVPPAFTALAFQALWLTLSLVLLAMVKERADLALRESEARFRQIAEVLEEGLAIVEPEQQRVIHASPGFAA